MRSIVALQLLAAFLGVAPVGHAQEIAPCIAIRSEIASRADRCIPVPADTVVPPPDTVPTPPVDSATWARAMGMWSPRYPTSCTKAQHDAYSAIGPDGKRYPVWHPPFDSTATGVCYYEHEHGSDPKLSPLDSLGPILFGYANEQTLITGNHLRHEDHVGHKVEFARHTFQPQNLLGPQDSITCDILVKLHQGTHSPDGFRNNLHEQWNRMSCNDGTFVNVVQLSQIGPAGWLQEQCTGTKIQTGPFVPEDSPVTVPPTNSNRSMGHRFLPTGGCAIKSRPNVAENWKSQNSIKAPDGSAALQYAWYWFVSDPSRFWTANGLIRTIDLCYMTSGTGWLVISNPCVNLRKFGDGVPVKWDDDASAFKGVQRGIRFDAFTLRRSSGPRVFYTDPTGAMESSLTPFPGSIRQEVSITMHNSRAMIGLGGPGHNFNAPGVRAPN
jgi:hypothetical protein